MSEIKVNTQHKDRLFKKVFETKEDLLSLYNAINGTEHKNPEDIEINTIENFIYMGMKNDVSFLITNVMNLYEQQSTINPNMPLRGFLYFAELYRKLFGNHTDLYSSRRIPLPTPQFVVFYNGEDKEEDRRVMRMSSAYSAVINEQAAIECTAILLNINYGHNKEIMQKCKKLEEYAILIHKIRQYIMAGMQKVDAVDQAVDECIEEGILTDILEKHRSEAKSMILEEYDEELHIKNEKEISFEDGLRQGMQQGIDQGIQQGMIQGMQQGQETLADSVRRLRNGESADDILKLGYDQQTVELAKTLI